MKFIAGLVLAVACAAQAQFEILDGKTTAGLRGIDAVSPQVAWASGSGGTVLLTTDGGANWKHCAVPPGGEKLDFRGVQGFDATTAIVMSSGKGDLSRLYKTIDGCQTWNLLFTNPDECGFWDSYRVDQRGHLGILIGDPVGKHFAVWQIDRDESAFQIKRLRHTPRVGDAEAAFAASNSAVFIDNVFFDFWIATGGKGGARVIKRTNHDFDSFGFDTFSSVRVPVGNRTESSGIFSLSFQKVPDKGQVMPFFNGVAVGGDYLKPEDATRTAAFTFDGGKTWTAAVTQTNGYRSAVTYDASAKTWITVGPNGSDISRDGGKNWTPLKPSATDPPDADKNWNAISLPFVVGSNGKIGRLNVKF